MGREGAMNLPTGELRRAEWHEEGKEKEKCAYPALIAPPRAKPKATLSPTAAAAAAPVRRCKRARKRRCQQAHRRQLHLGISFRIAVIACVTKYCPTRA